MSLTTPHELLPIIIVIKGVETLLNCNVNVHIHFICWCTTSSHEVAQYVISYVDLDSFIRENGQCNTLSYTCL